MLAAAAATIFSGCIDNHKISAQNSSPPPAEPAFAAGAPLSTVEPAPFPEESVARARRLEDLFPREEAAEIRYMMKRARRTGATSREMDLKTDRQNRKLLLQKWSWVGNGKKQAARKELKRRIEEELDRFERFQLAD